MIIPARPGPSCFSQKPKAGRIIPTNYIMDLESLIKYNAVTETGPVIRAFRTGKRRDVCVFPQYQKPTENEVKETRLFSWLFSGKGRYITTAIGYGFYYPHTPDGFKRYLMAHAASFCTTKENRELFQTAMEPGADVDSLFAGYEGKNGFSSGTGAVVADILSMETGKNFCICRRMNILRMTGWARTPE